MGIVLQGSSLPISMFSERIMQRGTRLIFVEKGDGLRYNGTLHIRQ
jgi:hypothetical protein